MSPTGHLDIVDVADAGTDRLLVHAENDLNGLAFMLSRLAKGPTKPTPIGVFRAVTRNGQADYGGAVTAQIAAAQARSGPGDLHKLLHSGATWTARFLGNCPARNADVAGQAVPAERAAPKATRRGPGCDG